MSNSIEKYEMVEHPQHYQLYEEVVEMINKVAGPFVASMWCKWNGFKYRMRMGTKPNNPIEQELGKEKKYLDLYEKYKQQWRNNNIVFDDLTGDERDYILTVILHNYLRICELLAEKGFTKEAKFIEDTEKEIIYG